MPKGIEAAPIRFSGLEGWEEDVAKVLNESGVGEWAVGVNMI